MSTQTTRRALIGGAGLAAVVALAPAVAAVRPTQGRDAELLAHWEGRQRCYRQMMAAGTYYDACSLSPALVTEHDRHETQIVEATAYTAQGLLAQAWIAWEAQGTVFREDDRARHELIHAADFNALEAIERRQELDWNDVAMLAVIRGLRTLAGQA